ncbi:MAG: glycosyltransferase family protein [Bacteroidota bacterium]
MKKRFLFIVQGEGRGHLTQAITLSGILTEAGHVVSAVLVGRSERREIPPFFYEKITAPVVSFESPNFVSDPQSKSVQLIPTLTHNIRRYKIFLQSLKDVHTLVEQYQPDVIINFYDFLGGLYYLLYKPDIPFVCVGHQYLLQHPAFEFPKRSWLNQCILSINTRTTSFGADKKLALSFRPMPDVPRLGIAVTPPLLRQEVLSASLPPVAGSLDTQPYFLAYINQNGFSEEVIAWHMQHPEVKIHCFWDKKDAGKEVKYHENLIFHQINDQKFLQLMRGCAGYVCTAGFESVCEAIYLGKPVMIIPVHKHFEQACNALDALQSGAGIASTYFDFSRFIAYLPTHQSQQQTFGEWQARTKEIFIRELESVCLKPKPDTNASELPHKVYNRLFRYTGSLLKRLAFALC